MSEPRGLPRVNHVMLCFGWTNEGAGWWYVISNMNNNRDQININTISSLPVYSGCDLVCVSITDPGGRGSESAPPKIKIVETYRHYHSLESSWGALSDGTISFPNHFWGKNHFLFLFLKKPHFLEEINLAKGSLILTIQDRASIRWNRLSIGPVIESNSTVRTTEYYGMVPIPTLAFHRLSNRECNSHHCPKKSLSLFYNHRTSHPAPQQTNKWLVNLRSMPIFQDSQRQPGVGLPRTNRRVWVVTHDHFHTRRALSVWTFLSHTNTQTRQTFTINTLLLRRWIQGFWVRLFMSLCSLLNICQCRIKVYVCRKGVAKCRQWVVTSAPFCKDGACHFVGTNWQKSFLLSGSIGDSGGKDLGESPLGIPSRFLVLTFCSLFWHFFLSQHLSTL
jgi:hypothetical protein